MNGNTLNFGFKAFLLNTLASDVSLAKPLVPRSHLIVEHFDIGNLRALPPHLRQHALPKDISRDVSRHAEIHGVTKLEVGDRQPRVLQDMIRGFSSSNATQLQDRKQCISAHHSLSPLCKSSACWWLRSTLES